MRFRLVLIVAVASLLAGCDSGQPAVTKEQAVERVDARAQESFQQLPAGATLKPRSSDPNVFCDSSGDRTFVENDYTIEYPSGWPVDQAITTLADYWTANDYKTVKDERAREGTPAFSAEHRDGFRIGIRLTYRDSGIIDAFLISSSPCL